MIPLSGHDRCAPSAERRGDHLYATAAPVSRWLLVEQPGHWGWDALASRTTPELAAQLTAAATLAGVRIVLIRRPGRSVAGSSKAWAYVDSRPGHELTRWGSYAQYPELLDGPLGGVGGRPDPEPIYLVCAHGRHDACCAIRGRPVAAALTRLAGSQVWECSHIGGDRFAANVVVLPEGLYYGHVTVDAVPALLAAHRAGEVLLPLLRGRSALPAPAQAAQHFAREMLAEHRLAALAPRAVDRTGAQLWRVVLARAGGDVTVAVRGEPVEPQRLTCSAGRVASVRTFRAV